MTRREPTTLDAASILIDISINALLETAHRGDMPESAQSEIARVHDLLEAAGGVVETTNKAIKEASS